MNCTECREKLNDHVDDALDVAGKRAIATHLATCADCTREFENLRQLRQRTAALAKDIAPARDLWPGIAAALGNSAGSRAEDSATSTIPFPSKRRSKWRTWAPVALAAGIAMLVGGILRWRQSASPAASWNVASLGGTPRVGSSTFEADGRLHLGDWLETDGSSRARVTVGSIGEVRVEPNSRVRLVAASSTDHRLELARGTLHALIWAPPRLFFVETPSATAIDLGCQYTLTVDEAGGSTLRVTSGYVALEHQGRESTIPAGAMCLTRKGSGPGTPFAADAAPELKQALVRYDFENAAATALADILKRARPDDAITLWHLLARTPHNERGRVFDTLAAVHRPPENVSRDGIINGNREMLARWAEQLGFLNIAATSKR